MLKLNKKIFSYALIIAAIVTIGVASYITLQAKHSNTKGSPGGRTSSTKAEDTALRNIPSGINKTSDLSDIKREPVPSSGWGTYSAPIDNFQVHYPSDWSVTGGRLPGSASGKSQPTAAVYLKSPHTEDGCCSINIKSSSLADEINYIERNDTDDNGQVSTTRLKLFYDVKDKDVFQYDKYQGVRYHISIRESTKPNVLNETIFLLGIQDKTVSLVISPSSLDGEKTAYDVIRYLGY